MANEAERDENRVTALLGETSLGTGATVPVYADPSTHRLYVDALISAGDIEIGAVEIKNSTDDTRATVGALGLYVDPQALTTLYSGTKTVPTGTAEALAGSQATRSVTVKALSTNTVAVYVGPTGVTTTSGFELLAGESVTMDISNLSTIYVISGSAAQIVRYIAL